MKKIIALLLVILTFGFIFAGCGEEDPPKVEVVDIKLFENGESKYTIVCSDSVPDAINTEITKLNTDILNKAGKALEVTDDFVNEDYGIVESPYEIVIGDCNRSVIDDIKPTLGAEDYIIKVVGTKIVVLGGSEASTANAVGTFRRKCISSNETAGLVIAGDYEFVYKGEYQIGDLKLNGTSIGEYVIAYEGNNYTSAVERLNAKIKDIAGVSLTVKTAIKSTNDAHRIFFGNCKTGSSNGAATDNGEYKLLSDGNDICIVAASAMQADDAVIDIIGKYFPTGKSETYNIEIKSGEEKVGLYNSETVKIMTQNLWENAHADAKSKQIISRNEYLVEIFEQKRPDIICFQEASRDRKNPNNNGKSIYDYVYDDLNQHYKVVCGTRNDDGKGSFTPIFYRDDLYTVLGSGCYRFNDRFDDSNNKSLSWVVFESKLDGKKFGVINSHFALFQDEYNDEKRIAAGKEAYGYSGETDNGLGETWRQGNAQQVIDRYLEMRAEFGSDLPVIMTGDFNANPNHESYKMLANYENFADSRLVSTGPSTQGYCTWHYWGELPSSTKNTKLLDHMFITKDVITVLSHEIVINSRSIKASDHCAVVCEFQFK